jgi:hypothetical protein
LSIISPSFDDAADAERAIGVGSAGYDTAAPRVGNRDDHVVTYFSTGFLPITRTTEGPAVCWPSRGCGRVDVEWSLPFIYGRAQDALKKIWGLVVFISPPTLGPRRILALPWVRVRVHVEWGLP